MIRARPVGEDPAEGGALSVEILPQADGVPEGASFFFSVGLLDAPDALYELTAAGGFAPGAGGRFRHGGGGYRKRECDLSAQSFPFRVLFPADKGDGCERGGLRFFRCGDQYGQPAVGSAVPVYLAGSEAVSGSRRAV